VEKPQFTSSLTKARPCHTSILPYTEPQRARLQEWLPSSSRESQPRTRLLSRARPRRDARVFLRGVVGCGGPDQAAETATPPAVGWRLPRPAIRLRKSCRPYSSSATTSPSRMTLRSTSSSRTQWQSWSNRCRWLPRFEPNRHPGPSGKGGRGNPRTWVRTAIRGRRTAGGRVPAQSARPAAVRPQYGGPASVSWNAGRSPASGAAAP